MNQQKNKIMSETKKKVKIVYFVTLCIKYAVISKIQGSNIEKKTEKITVFQKIQKLAKNDTDAYNKTILEAQTKYHNIRLIAYTVTELTEAIFEADVKEMALNSQIENELDKQEKENN